MPPRRCVPLRHPCFSLSLLAHEEVEFAAASGSDTEQLWQVVTASRGRADAAQKAGSTRREERPEHPASQRGARPETYGALGSGVSVFDAFGPWLAEALKQ